MARINVDGWTAEKAPNVNAPVFKEFLSGKSVKKAKR